ncbi:unnamed protein product [Closterium sp. NIES-54]
MAREDVSLLEHTSGSCLAPEDSASRVLRTQWLTRDAAARLSVCNALPLEERVHFGALKTAKELYDAIVARYSSPSTSALGRIMLPYLFPELSDFPTVADLMTHLRSSDVRYCTTLKPAFLAANPPPMYIILYYLFTRLPDSLRAVRDRFLALGPTEITLSLREKHLLGAKTSSDTVAASLRGVLPPFSCPPLLLLLPLTSFVLRRSVLRLLLVRGAAAARARGVRVVGGPQAGVVAGVVVGVEAVGAAVEVVGVVEAVEWAKGARVAVVVELVGAEATGLRLVLQLMAAEAVGVDSSNSHASRSIAPLRSFYRCFCRLKDACCTEYGDEQEIPNWSALLRKRVDVFALDFDKINAGIYAMYAGSISADGECYSCVPRVAGVEASALGACESAAACTASAEALHTFTLDSSVSRYFFRDCTTVTPLTAHVSVSLAAPSGAPVVARASTVLPCPAVPSGSLLGLHLPSFYLNLVSNAVLQDELVGTYTPGGERVAICSDSRTGEHLTTFTQRPGSSLTHRPLSRHRGGEFSTRLLDGFCRAEGIAQSFMLPASPQQNGIAERCIDLVMEVDPPPLVEPLEVSYDTSGPAEGGDPAADDTAATRRSPRLETPPGSLPWPSSPHPQHVAVYSGAAGSGDTRDADSGGAGPEVADSRGAESRGAGSGGADSGGAASPSGGGVVGAPAGGSGTGQQQYSRRQETLSPQQLRDWVVRRGRVARASSTGAGGAGGAGAAGAGGARAAGAGAAGGTATAPRRPFFYPQPQSSLPPPDSALCQVLGLPSSTGLTPPLLCPLPDQSQPPLLPGSPLPAPSPYPAQTCSPAKRREPESRLASPDRTDNCACRPCPPHVTGTHTMALRPSSVPLRVALPSPPVSSLPNVLDPESDLARAASPTVTLFLVTVVTDPSFESTVASTLVTELVEFAATRRLDFVASIVTESESVCPPSVGGELALSTITGEYSSQWQTAMDAEMASWKSASTYVDEVPPPWANIVLQRFGFEFSSPQSTPLPTGHSLSAPPSDESVEPSGDSAVVTGFSFSLGSGSVSWRSTRSSSLLGSSCEAEIYVGAVAAHELRWLTYVLTDLGERPRSPPVLYVDNKAMISLCEEQRLKHRTKHIALRYFLARELHQRCQLRLAYVASQANTADVFTKARGSGDHQHFCTAFGLVPTLPHLLVA